MTTNMLMTNAVRAALTDPSSYTMPKSVMNSQNSLYLGRRRRGREGEKEGEKERGGEGEKERRWEEGGEEERRRRRGIDGEGKKEERRSRREEGREICLRGETRVLGAEMEKDVSVIAQIQITALLPPLLPPSYVNVIAWPIIVSLSMLP